MRFVITAAADASAPQHVPQRRAPGSYVQLDDDNNQQQVQEQLQDQPQRSAANRTIKLFLRPVSADTRMDTQNELSCEVAAIEKHMGVVATVYGQALPRGSENAKLVGCTIDLADSVERRRGLILLRRGSILRLSQPVPGAALPQTAVVPQRIQFHTGNDEIFGGGPALQDLNSNGAERITAARAATRNEFVASPHTGGAAALTRPHVPINVNDKSPTGVASPEELREPIAAAVGISPAKTDYVALSDVDALLAQTMLSGRGFRVMAVVTGIASQLKPRGGQYRMTVKLADDSGELNVLFASPFLERLVGIAPSSVTQLSHGDPTERAQVHKATQQLGMQLREMQGVFFVTATEDRGKLVAVVHNVTKPPLKDISALQDLVQRLKPR